MQSPKERHLVIRIGIVAVGVLALVLGLIGWFLPLMPGWPFVIGGLAILAGEFVWARRLLDGIRAKLPRRLRDRSGGEGA
jgi:hypothetical protein